MTDDLQTMDIQPEGDERDMETPDMYNMENEDGNNGEPETEEEYNLRLKMEQDAHDNRFFDLSKADPDDLSDIADSQSGSRTMYN